MKEWYTEIVQLERKKRNYYKKWRISMETLIIFAYLAWACYSGYKVLTGRSEWLDRKSPINIICKLTLSAAVIFDGFEDKSLNIYNLEE